VNAAPIVKSAGGKTKPLPYYEADGIAIYHGDCREIAPRLGTFDLLCSDPPYGIGQGRAAVRVATTGFAKQRDYGDSEWDDAPPSDDLLTDLRSRARFQILFGGNYFSLPPSRGWLVWDKEARETIDQGHCELAWTNFDIPIRRKRHLWVGMWKADKTEKRYHPTQKPLAVMTWAISLCPEKPATVIDPFMGSGTTLVACRELGIRAVGIEREERYCEIAVKRLAQRTLFGTTTP
jgi:DNA modification methylase